MDDKICKALKCTRVLAGRGGLGYCSMHYQRHTKYGDATFLKEPRHGYSGEPEYKIWKLMKQRCRDPNTNNYKYYGARGIAVCDRWEKSFPNFLEDMGRRPDPSLTLDRINNDGNYEPGNVRWADNSTQVTNRRKLSRSTKKVNEDF